MKDQDSFSNLGKKQLVEQSETNQNGDSSFEFMREQIKNRPINRRKLLKRTMTTAGMAVLFGMIACVTFLLLEPVISNRLNPEEDMVSEITFPEEIQESEMKLEDMIIEDEPPLEEILDELAPTIVEQRVGLEISDYSSLYEKMYEVAKQHMSCMVEITGVTQDTDWMHYSYDSTTTVSGLIVADNGKDILIVAPGANITNAENIVVNFCDRSEHVAQIVQSDENTGLVVLAVDMHSLGDGTLDQITYASFGSSNSSTLLGSVVLAVGSPMGSYGSLGYGMVTGCNNLIEKSDINYRYFTTDIYCSQSASGVVIDTKGKVLGFISQEYAPEDMKNQLCVIGISELRKTIEQLSNGKEMVKIGILGRDVPNVANANYKVPFGAYVDQVEMDSPALNSGIQSGDVIVKLNDLNISTFLDYTNSVRQLEGGQTIKVVLMRYNGEEYKEIEVDVTLP